MKASRKNTIAFAVSTRAAAGARGHRGPDHSRAVLGGGGQHAERDDADAAEHQAERSRGPAATCLPGPRPRTRRSAAAPSSRGRSRGTRKTPSVHIVERTDLIFVHSEARACPRWVRTTGIGEVYEVPVPACQLGACCGVAGCWAGGCWVTGGWGVLIGRPRAWSRSGVPACERSRELGAGAGAGTGAGGGTGVGAVGAVGGGPAGAWAAYGLGPPGAGAAGPGGAPYGPAGGWP